LCKTHLIFTFSSRTASLQNPESNLWLTFHPSGLTFVQVFLSKTAQS